MNTVTFQGNTLHLDGALPAAGAKAPDFSLTANDLSARTLKEYAGKVLVLVCVPSLDTPVCDMEVRRFNTEAAALSDKVRIAAVSRDLPFAQARWCGAAGAKAVETLSDYRNGSFGKAYGIYLKELDLLARAVFVVAPDGTLAYSQLVPEVTNEPDYAAVLDAVKKLAQA
jgi:thiol peroxidase